MSNAWTAFYWGDYLGDTGHLSPVQHGVYLLLMAHYYRTGRAIPANADQVHRICRCTTHAEKQASGEVLTEFFTLDGSVYRHRRIERELAKQTEYKHKLSQGGRKGAEKRWHDGLAIREANDQGSGEANGLAMVRANGVEIAEPQPQPQSQESQNLLPAPLPRNKREKEANARVLAIYETYPRHVGRAVALKAIRKAIPRVAAQRKCSQDDAGDFIYSAVIKFGESPAGNKGEFTPHCATWMNADRFLDDPAEWWKAHNGSNGNGTVDNNLAVFDRVVGS